MEETRDRSETGALEPTVIEVSMRRQDIIGEFLEHSTAARKTFPGVGARRYARSLPYRIHSISHPIDLGAPLRDYIVCRDHFVGLRGTPLNVFRVKENEVHIPYRTFCHLKRLSRYLQVRILFISRHKAHPGVTILA